MPKNPIPFFILNNGIKMPQVGLGTWQMPEGEDTEKAIVTALECGYRLIDTAAVYGNETNVGHAIAHSNIPREEIFVTTKIWNSDQGPDTLNAFYKSLERLKLGYVDLYLIHWPAPAGDRYVETWRLLEKLYKQKLIRAIGVSNFSHSHLKKILLQSSIVPAVNQIEMHPYFHEQKLAAFCKENNIQVESYSPLGGQGSSLLQEKIIEKIAHKHSKSSAQIVIRWHIQQGFVVIPKATSKEHFESNIDVFDFELSHDDIAQIDSLNTSKRRGPDPDFFNSGIKTGLVQLAHKFGLVHWHKEK